MAAGRGAPVHRRRRLGLGQCGEMRVRCATRIDPVSAKAEGAVDLIYSYPVSIINIDDLNLLDLIAVVSVSIDP